MSYYKPTLESFTTSYEKLPENQFGSEIACLAIPIFKPYEDDQRLKDYIVRSAAWSLRSWVLHSDLQDYHLPAYLYIDDDCRDLAYPILKENNIPDDMIMYGPTNDRMMGKCMNPYFDERFDKYHYLVVPDSDMFAIPVNGKKHNFFYRLFQDMERKGIGVFGNTVSSEGSKDTWAQYWWLYNFPEVDNFEGKFELFKNALKELLDDIGVSLYVNGGYSYVNCAIRIFHNETYKHREWFAKALDILRCDESAISVWNALDTENNLVWEAYILKIKNTIDLIDLGDEPLLVHSYCSADDKWTRMLGSYYR